MLQLVDNRYCLFILTLEPKARILSRFGELRSVSIFGR